VADVERLLEEDKQSSPALRAAVSMLIMVVKLLAGRINTNSRNSSKPPASDPNRAKKSRAKNRNKRGGQNGHPGTTLTPVDQPDEINVISIDRRTLPKGHYQESGCESRQVFHIRVSRHVIEYQAQILEDDHGQQFVAPFPPGVTRPIQYGASVRAHAVYLSPFQRIPYERIQRQFDEIVRIPISTGSLFNFNQDAFGRLAPFLSMTKQELAYNQSVLHVDETGINIDGKRHWLHGASNEKWTLIEAHPQRGGDAMKAIGVLPHFTGYLIHDHWKPYYKFDACRHSLCNAHHKRELTFAHEQDGQQWADKMEKLLDELNDKVKAAGGLLNHAEAQKQRKRYRRILRKADEECPPPIPDPGKKKTGRLARSKSRNLLERLRDYEEDVLRFMEIKEVPFTNNQGERDIRMTKVQQKISGCFRSMRGAEIYCGIRSYLSTCQKHNIGAGDALEQLFAGKWPDFIQNKLDSMPVCAE